VLPGRGGVRVEASRVRRNRPGGGRFWPDLDAVDAYVTGLDKLLDTRTALLRPLGHEPAIQAHWKQFRVGEGEEIFSTQAEAAIAVIGGRGQGNQGFLADQRLVVRPMRHGFGIAAEDGAADVEPFHPAIGGPQAPIGEQGDVVRLAGEAGMESHHRQQ
jgi:hypothetical protein